jgi:anti-sigma regulatory factor (Ser/Thr protein kinase)
VTAAAGLRALLDSLRRAFATVQRRGPEPGEVAAAVEAATAHLSDLVGQLRAEAAVVDALHSIGRRLTAQLDIDRIVQEATDAATMATGAAFGAFFYNLVNDLGESYTLYTLSGVPREAFAGFPMPRNTAVFAPTFDGTGTVRSDDITADPRFGRNEPFHGMPEGHLPVRSYLAVPVISPTSGEVLGGFFFGHPRRGQFVERHEYLAEGIAGYAAIALDNARLFERERNLATELSRSMLPVVPDIPGLRIVARYLPAATGIKVGGDWFDVIRLASGRIAFVIGDVVGHGVTAATVMGQIRTAIRSYALLELEPSELLRNVSQLTASMPDSSFVTCFYAVHDPEDDTLTYANAGHLPAVLIHPDGTIEQIGEALAKPLGVGTEFPQLQTAFPPRTDLVLYTDGLVESRTRDLTVGIERLLAALADLRSAPDTGAACDQLIELLTHNRHDDDIALIHVHHANGQSCDGRAGAEFHDRAGADPERLIGLRTALAQWASHHGMTTDQRDDMVLASYEAMANTAEHAYPDGSGGQLDLRATLDHDQITVTVTDYGTWKDPGPTKEYHGRGLTMIDALAHHSELTHRPDGTTITMRWNL